MYPGDQVVSHKVKQAVKKYNTQQPVARVPVAGLKQLAVEDKKVKQNSKQVQHIDVYHLHVQPGHNEDVQNYRKSKKFTINGFEKIQCKLLFN